jgi:hypothetical protein
VKLRPGMLFLCGSLAAAWLPAQAPDTSIPNWPAPATWSPRARAAAWRRWNATPPLPFIGLAPCRVVDTRGNGFTGQFGPPALVGGRLAHFHARGTVRDSAVGLRSLPEFHTSSTRPARGTFASIRRAALFLSSRR